MKANAPERIWIDNLDEGFWFDSPSGNKSIEYIRSDAFIDKACDFLKSYRQDTFDGMGYIAGIVNDKTIEEFRNYMKGE